MERGILWLALLAVFIWLAWQGKNEYQKVENYRVWAEQFERAKYDIYAVLGQKGTNITWGKPTQKGLVELETFSLKDVQSIQLLVDSQIVNLNNLPRKGRDVALEFLLPSTQIRIPFTEIPLAAEWGKFLQQELQRLKLEQTD
ncbi:hypothetical protein [Chroococcidiopsis sp. TS-821]|uniref:hypothetical protein n=1 Tax=Chroococcidiopsis sp. TS-821 TaxID=1378066 RepID=UPI000CEE28A1|nr:hypothetical protein [Chroococcidiopsis sp. TS-821]PPS42677.1 hypothetical protein B1A85_13215 [Chroococcidiopsis sp. TS-821]